MGETAVDDRILFINKKYSRPHPSLCDILYGMMIDGFYLISVTLTISPFMSINLFSIVNM